jgi:hypothetical protein
MIILAPISVGELLDKISILTIKYQRIDISKKENVLKELSELESIKDSLNLPDVQQLYLQLYAVNSELWFIEDYKRNCEKEQTFDDGFINAARQVYLKNDLRARIKRDINLIVGSSIVEEKSY